MNAYGPNNHIEQFRTELCNGNVPITVYGLGKMGLPLAAVFADVFGNVTGVDTNEVVVQSVNQGRSHVEGEPNLPELVSDTVKQGDLKATQDSETAALEGRIHIIIVPTLIDENKNPNLTIVKQVVNDIARNLKPGDLVLVESTVPPGTCSNVVVPILSDVSELETDEFGVAFCPERTSSGRAIRDIRRAYPKVVGGTDDKSTRRAEVIYDEINQQGVISVSNAETAEAEKVFEGLFRDVNIALANEIAKLSEGMGVDAIEAIKTANTIPFINIHDPGPGVGGHCIPYYPHFVMDQYRVNTPLIRTSRDINDNMPLFTVEKLTEEMSQAGLTVSHSTVAILGLTYKPGVKETRASPSRAISMELIQKGAETLLVDPMLEDFSEFAGENVELANLKNRDPDAVVIVTPHKEFKYMDWNEFPPLVIVDARDSITNPPKKHRVYAIGRGVVQNGDLTK